jgi:hypothetical protein
MWLAAALALAGALCAAIAIPSGIGRRVNEPRRN